MVLMHFFLILSASLSTMTLQKKKTSKVKYRKMISGIINYNTKKKRNLRTIIIVSSLIQKNDDLHKKSPSHTAENTKTQCSGLREKPY